MNKFFKLVLTVLGFDALFFALCLTPAFFGGYSGYDGLAALLIGLSVAALAFFVQLIVGLGFSGIEKRKALGQALVLSSGILFLIGLSVCGGMAILA